MGLIYKIQNKNNGKIYIGQTAMTLKALIAKHKEVVPTSDCHIHRAIRKYGWDSFDIDIVEDQIPNEQLNNREIYWIDYYNSFEEGYNMNRGGNGRLVSEAEVLELWEEGNTITDITNKLPTKKDTVRQILNEHGVTSNDIQHRKAIHRQLQIDYNYIRKLWEEGKTTREIRALNGNIGQGLLLKIFDEIGISTEERAKRQHKAKEVHQYSLDGTYMATYESATIAGERLGINPYQIRAACSRKQKTSGGYIWKYQS